MRIRQYLKGAVLALAIAGVAAPVQAQDEETPSTGVFKSAQQVYELCLSSDSAEVEMCEQYLMAAHDMMKLYADTERGGDKICLASSTPVGEIRQVMVAYWEDDPDGLKYSAVSTIYNALVDEYGCE